MIVFQFAEGNNWESWAIARWGNAVPLWSHVDIVMPNGWLAGARSENYLIDGIKYPAGVQIRPPNYMTPKRRQRLGFPASTDELLKLDTLVQENLNRKYDMKAIWGFLLGRALHSTGRDICSAFACEIAHKLGKISNEVVEEYQVSPSALYIGLGFAGAQLVS